MSRTRNRKVLAFTMALPLLYLAGAAPDAPAGFTLFQEAHAVVGAPLTPVSAAGVARRTTRRAVVVAESSATQAAAASTAATQQQQAATAQQQAATAQQQAATAQQQAATAQQQAAAPRPPGAPAAGAVVSSLPAGCKPETRDAVEYQNCGGVYYRAAFQGNNLVYVVQ
jgi:type II secretory pathway pseudopilin PulG